MNTWRDRLLIGLVLFLAQRIHAEINAPLPNTQFWAMIFYGTAATLEAFIALATPKVLEGPICDDMQNLALICILIDAFGCMAYMRHIPAVYYNTIMWVLSFVQWVRLLFVDSDHARAVWNHLVRRPHLLGA